MASEKVGRCVKVKGQVGLIGFASLKLILGLPYQISNRLCLMLVLYVCCILVFIMTKTLIMIIIMAIMA